MIYSNLYNKLPQIVYKLLVVILFVFTHLTLKANQPDSIQLSNHIVSIEGSTFRLPYTNAQGHVIPTFSHKIKTDYTYRANTFLMLKSGITYQYSDTIFSNRQHTFLVDFMGIAYYKKLHFDVGLHTGTYSVRKPPVNSNGPIAQYLSIGGGITFPLFKKWAIDLTLRKTINITFQKNTYTNMFEGFIGVSYIINGNNNYLRRNKSKRKRLQEKDAIKFY